MRIKLNLYTPSSYMSRNTLNWAISDISKIVEGGVFEGLKEIFPNASRTQMKKRISHSVEFSLVDAKKGSLTLVFVGAVFGVIGKILYDIGIDIAKSNPKYIELKNRINKEISPIIAEKVINRLGNKSVFGHLEAKDVETTLSESDNFETQVNINIYFNLKPSGKPLLGLEEQLEQALSQIKEENEQPKKHKKKKRKQRKK